MVSTDETQAYTIVESLVRHVYARRDGRIDGAGVDRLPDFSDQLLTAVEGAPKDPPDSAPPAAVATEPAAPARRSGVAAVALPPWTSPAAGGLGASDAASRADTIAPGPALGRDVPASAVLPQASLLAALLQRYIAMWLGSVGDLQSLQDVIRAATTSSSASPSTVGGSDAAGPISTDRGGVDQLGLDGVTWLHEDVSRWRVTSEITNLQIDARSITINHSKAGQWPTLNPDGVEIEGNPWVFVNRGGKWYAATYEWLRTGQVTKRITADNIGAHTKKEPLESWVPQPGELVGFMVSTPARLGQRTVNERSNVVLVRWPG